MPLHFIQKHPKTKALSTFPFSRNQGAASHLLFTQRGQLSVTSSANCLQHSQPDADPECCSSDKVHRAIHKNTNPNAFSTRKTLCPGNSGSI